MFLFNEENSFFITNVATQQTHLTITSNLKISKLTKMLRLCTFLKRTPFEPTRCLVRAIFVTAQRKNESAPKTDDNQPKKEFQTIFKFPHMRILVLLNRLKVYQTIITGLTIPVSLTLSHFNVIQFNTSLAACAVGEVF